MNVLTPEQIIEKSNAAILAQGELAKQPFNEGGSCFYAKESSEVRCAVGILLTREDALKLENVYHYGEVANDDICEMDDGSDIADLFLRNGINMYDVETTNVLRELQNRHDHAGSFEQWKSNLESSIESVGEV